MPTAWSEFEAVEEPQSLVKWDEFTPVDESQAGTDWSLYEPAEEQTKPPATFTLGGKEYPLPDQANRPPMPRSVSQFAGLPPEQTRMEELKETLPGIGDFAAQVMEPTSIAGAGRGITEALITTPEDLKTQAREAGDIRRMAEGLGVIPQPGRPFAPQVTPEAEPELPEGIIFDAALRNELAKGVEELTTGENQAILAATMGAGAIPRIGGMLQRIVSGYFGYEGAKAVTEGAKQLREATTPEGKAQAWGNIIKGGAIAIPAGLHAVRPPPIKPRIVEAIAKADAVGLTKSAQAVADVVKREQTVEIQAKVEPLSDRPQQLETEISPAPIEKVAPTEPAPLTGPDVIKSIIELPDVDAGNLRQKPAVEAGMKLTEADVPALEAARDKAGADMLAELEAGNDVAFKAQYGRNIWFSGAIEGARRKGPNYDTFIEQQKASGVPEKAQSVSERSTTVSQTEPIVSQTTTPTPPEAVPARPVGGEPAGQPAVGAAEVPAQVALKQLAPEGAESLSYSDFYDAYKQKHPEPKIPTAKNRGGMFAPPEKLKGAMTQFRKKGKVYRDDLDVAYVEHFQKELQKGVQPDTYQIQQAARTLLDLNRRPEAEALLSEYGYTKNEGGQWAPPSTVGKPAEVGPGMGGAKASEPVDPRAQLAQLTDSIATLAKEGKSAPAKAFDLGRTLSQAKERVTSTLDGLKAAGQYMKTRLEGKPVATEYRGVLGDRHLALSESSVNARKWMQNVKKALPDPKVREAISDWVDTGGDAALLTKAASETKPQYKAGYERAQKLTPEEKVVAENLKNYFDSRLQEAIDAGVLEDGIENYIHRAYEAESPWKKGVIQELRSGLFTGNPALAKKRVFEYDFEAEKLGKKPVKDFAQRVAAYDLALNKSIADRAAVKAMMEIKMSDGRPMIDVGGGGKIIENAAGEAQATLINRSAKKIDPNDPKANRGDFKPFDHPALRKWKWATEDSAGKPIFVQGDVLIHPEAIGGIRKLLEPSAIRRNPIGRAALGVSSTIKQTMLDLSGFHPVQIAVHGTEHRTFAPVKEIDFTNPDVRGLIRGGAAVGETSGHAAFSEGVSGAGSSLTKHIPWAGERLQAYNSWLFEDYIPRLKVAMGLHALERNRGRYKDLSSDQLYQLTADQMNAAFGEQNYTMLGRSKTTQDALRLALLAPDFLEARGRFAAQAFTKYGAEQRQALILGAVTMYITARMLNKMMTDEYHFEPKNAFNLVVDGKSYGLRTVQGDLIHAVTEPGKFINHRLNPVYGKPALEFVTGRDYFGRKREGMDKLKDLAMTPIPIGLRGVLDNQEQTLLDTFLNSFGLVTKRDSPSSDIAELAKEWKKDNDIKTGPGEFIYDAEQDPYRPIKLAAERDDEAGARSEIAKAINEGMKRSQIIQHFKLSEKHRFTGSVANERKFLESLTEDQKKIYQDAKQERKRIRALVMRALP